MLIYQHYIFIERYQLIDDLVGLGEAFGVADGVDARREDEEHRGRRIRILEGLDQIKRLEGVGWVY
jgi:hypothetical protein